MQSREIEGRDEFAFERVCSKASVNRGPSGPKPIITITKMLAARELFYLPSGTTRRTQDERGAFCRKRTRRRRGKDGKDLEEA